MDWNEVVDRLANQIASRVIEKINSNTGGWPPADLEVKKEVSDNTPPWKTDEEVAAVVDKALAEQVDSGVEDPGDEVVAKETYSHIDEQPTKMQQRREYWQGQDVRTIRRLMAEYEGEDVAKYKITPKKEMVEMAASLEVLTGHNLDEGAGNDGVEDAPAESEDEEEFTYEEALRTDLAELKEIAVANGVEESKLVGLDVDAVADLLFEEDEELTPEEVMDLDFGRLMKLAADVGVDVPDNIARQDLALKILDAVEQQ